MQLFELLTMFYTIIFQNIYPTSHTKLVYWGFIYAFSTKNIEHVFLLNVGVRFVTLNLILSTQFVLLVKSLENIFWLRFAYVK